MASVCKYIMLVWFAMVTLMTPAVGDKFVAQDFHLLGVDGVYHSLGELRGKCGTVIVFMCNHCPYVKSIIEDIVSDAVELKRHGVSFVAINPNDSAQYPEDSYAKMQDMVLKHKLPFCYLVDPTQEVARSYGAVCTPDFFGFDANAVLVYRGRLRSPQSCNEAGVQCNKRELLAAMVSIAETGAFAGEQLPSIGCSIKWKV